MVDKTQNNNSQRLVQRDVVGLPLMFVRLKSQFLFFDISTISGPRNKAGGEGRGDQQSRNNN
jgi:hypothetical protein